MNFTVTQIAQLLGGEVTGDGARTVDRLAKIEEAGPGSLSFLANPRYENALYTTQATAVIVTRTFVPRQPIQAALIAVDDPYLAFTQLLEEYQRQLALAKTGVEQPAYLAASARVGEGGYRGAFSYVGEHCQLGDHVKIYPQAYVGDGARIGDYSVIHAGARIHPNTVVGRHCVIQSGAVVGSEGFGFAPQPDGSYRPVPQVGNVVLEDNVHIGANTTVDCATLGSTVIRSGAKLDNLIQIAHNVEVGRHTVIAAQAGVSGSAKLGDHCVVAGQVGIVGHISLANGTKIGAQSGLSKSVNQPNTAVNGSPAFGYKESLRVLAVYRRLPELERRLANLEAQLAQPISPNGLPQDDLPAANPQTSSEK